MPPEQKNGSAKKSKRADRETRKATTRELTAHKVNAPQAKKPRTRLSVSRSASSTLASSKSASSASTSSASASSKSASRARSASSTAAASSKRPTVALIGAGRLGTALALALGESGYSITALVARRPHHAQRAARTLSPRPLALDASQLDSLPDTDLLLITTPDDQIAEVAAQIAKVFVARDATATRKQPQPPSRRRPTRIALHASGALSSDALAPLGAHGFAVGSLHPLVSISDSRGGARNLRGAFYAVEGDARALRAARRIVSALGGQSFSVATRDKALYHAAAVIASGHTVALFSLATDLLAHCGLSPARARRVLLPLLRSTLDNLSAHAPAKALTGTFARADLSTVRKHLSALRRIETRDALAIYGLLGERSLELVAQRGDAADASIVAEITRTLSAAMSKDKREA